MAGTRRAPYHLYRFVATHPEVEAVLQHVGLRTWDLLLVDVEGRWVRDEFASPEEAGAVCRELGVPMHRGWDERMVRRMNRAENWTRPDGQRRAL